MGSIRVSSVRFNLWMLYVDYGFTLVALGRFEEAGEPGNRIGGGRRLMRATPREGVVNGHRSLGGFRPGAFNLSGAMKKHPLGGARV